MASPFTSFRKNQKVWLAILGVVCMVTFVLVPGSVRVGCGRSHTEEHAVDTKVRSVTMSELQHLAQQRERVDAFANLLDSVAAQAAKSRFAPPLNGFRPSISRDINDRRPLREALDTWLKVQKAKDLGIEVSQDSVTEYIKTRSGAALSRRMMEDFLKQHGMSEPELYVALGNELLAERVDELYGFGETTSSELSPVERKELWDRQNRRAHVEVVALHVKDFVGLVEEPTDQKLKEFFERYRDRLPNPESPEPGFRLPYLAQFQYLWVSQPRLYEAAMVAITPAEIAQRYDELVKAKNDLGGKLEHKEEDWKKSLPPAEKEADKKDPSKTAPVKPATDTPKTDKPKTGAKSSDSGASAAPRNDASREFGREVAAYPVALAAQGDGRETAQRVAQADPPTKASEKTADDAKTKKKDDEAAKTDDKAEPLKSPPLKLLDPFKTPERRLDEIHSDLTIPENIRELPPGRDPPKFKPLWAVETAVREDLAKEMARRDAQRLLELIKEPLDKHHKEYERLTRKKKDGALANPLADPATARKLIDEAWNTFAEGKKTAWKKSFEDRKKFVDAEIKRLMEEKQLTLEGFKKLATDSKNDEWQKLLEEQQQLTDVDKLAASTLATWQARLTKKRTNLEPETSATTPEKVEGPKADKEATGTKDKAASRGAPAKKEGEAEKAAAEKKEADDAKKDPKEGSGKSSKTDDGKKADDQKTDAKKTDAKKADDGKLEPTEPVISLKTTDPKLDERDFRRRKYPLASTRLVDQDFQDFMSGAFERAPLFQPKLASAMDEQYLFWKIYQRPSEVLQWENPRTQEVVATTRETVLEEYLEYEARGLVLKRAQELADQVSREARTFPVEEVLRLFRLDGQGGTSAPDRPSLSVSASTTETYAVVGEIFEDGKRRALDAASAPRGGPLEAPPPSVFGDLEQARQQAVMIAAAQQKPGVLVIVAKSIGQDRYGLVFQGVQGFRWQAPEKNTPAGDEAKNVVSGPGRLAGRTFPLEVGSGDNAKTVEAVGRRLEPFTWDQIEPLAGRSEDDPGVPGLDFPGEVFGATVFRLQPGELGAALNQPQTIAYVAQVTGFDYSVRGSVYPADGTLEKSPLRDAFLTSCRIAINAEEQFPRRWQQYQQQLAQHRMQVAQFPQFANLLRPTPPTPPASVTFRSIRATRQYQAWREGLYAEFRVKNDETLDRADR